MSKREYTERAKLSNKYLSRRGSKSLRRYYPFGHEHTLVSYRKKNRVETVLMEMPWAIVILTAMIYAVGIVFFKIFWFEVFGKPQIFAKHSVLERELKASRNRKIP